MKSYKIYFLKLFISLSFLILGVSTTFSQADTLDCERFRIGKFEAIKKAENKRYVVERDEEYQTERAFELNTGREEINSKEVLKVTWLTECSYNLIAESSDMGLNEMDLYLNQIGGINVEIIEIDGDCFKIKISVAKKVIKTSWMCKFE